MKRSNLMDDKAKAPDPDDLTSELPSPAHRSEARNHDSGRRETRPNPDASAPHIPPPDDQ
jgi:hypothetical protein